jgi:hypothetical protein
MTIGPCEAIAIWSVLRTTDEPPPPRRPAAHDLLCALIERLGARLIKVVIDDLWNEVYYAKLHLQLDGETLAVDSRPSDAIAIALRMGAPLFAAPAVLAAAGGKESPAESPPGEDEPLDLDLGLDDP